MPPVNSSATTDWEKYGIPPRQPSMELWAHLFGKDKIPAPPNSEIIPPPIAPLDKTGTSARMLLYDTQGTLEKFSVKTDKLFSSLEETKREINTVNVLFQREHETLRDDVVDLLNRSQTELQKTIGSPAQDLTLERLTKDVDRRLEALDKRIDAVLALNQSQGQVLQIQSQTLHTMQDQQGKIIAAVMPLLPLLQAIPLHIESARNMLKDTIEKSSRTPAPTSTYQRPTLATSPRSCGEKRSSSTLNSDELSPSFPPQNKRRRLSGTPQTSDQRFEHPDEAASALVVKETISQAEQHLADPNPQDRAEAIPLSTMTAPQNCNVNVILKTPRRPLAELLLKARIPPLTWTSTARSVGTTSRPQSRLSSPLNLDPSPHTLGPTPVIHRPPRLLRVPSSVSDIVGAARIQAPAEAARKQSSTDDEKRRSKEKTKTPSWSLRAKARLEPSNESLMPHLSHAPSAVSPGASLAFLATLSATAGPHPFPLNTPLAISKQTQHARPDTSPSPPLLQSLLTMQEPRPNRSGMKPIPMGNMRIRDRRSPFREGRRFIPLQDSDDEDEVE